MDEAHAEWCDKWVPRCPDGHRLRVRRALGFRERNVGELELRVALGSREGGVCEVVVDERDDEVHVRLFLHGDEDAGRSRDYTDCPVRVWLERPLGDRAVIDVDSNEELPFYTPRYSNGIEQADHGYRPANRRRPSRDSE